MFTKKAQITSFLIAHGSQEIAHVKNGTLHDHLLRIGDTIENWGLEDEVINAGMCHSLYGTDFFHKKILSDGERHTLRALIGGHAEKLVFAFGSIERGSLKKINDSYVFSGREGGADVLLTKEEASDILHILLANDLDHITAHTPGAWGSSLDLYTPWKDLLTKSARLIVEQLAVDSTLNPSNVTDAIRFIAHAGIQIKTLEHSILVDPWLYPSTLKSPLVEGFAPGNKTIDYLIPEPKNTAKDIVSDTILLSHFHTHHSPLRELKELLALRRVRVICPPLTEKQQNELEFTLGEHLYDRLSLQMVAKDSTIEVGSGITVTCLTHTHPNHLAFFVKTKNTSVLHISDASANEDKLRSDFSATWDKFFRLSPEFVFIGAAGHNQRLLNGIVRDISENMTFTPVQAAKFVARLLPKHAGVIGFYNFSIWDNRQEYAMSNEDIEGMFYWALSFLAPSVKIHLLRPGDSFQMEKKS